MVTRKPRIYHRLAYKGHNPSASQSFISTVILEKRRNDLQTVSSSNHSSAYSEVSSGSQAVHASNGIFLLRFVLILCLKHFVCKKTFPRHCNDFFCNFSNVLKARSTLSSDSEDRALKIRNSKLFSRVQTIIPAKRVTAVAPDDESLNGNEAGI